MGDLSVGLLEGERDDRIAGRRVVSGVPLWAASWFWMEMFCLRRCTRRQPICLMLDVGKQQARTKGAIKLRASIALQVPKSLSTFVEFWTEVIIKGA